MGLDVYVGSLTRYYSKQWETVIQRYARENGYKFQFVGADSDVPAEGAIIDPAEIQPAVKEWQRILTQRLGKNLTASFFWEDDMSSPYFTDKADYDGWGALTLWAAYADQPQLSIPQAYPEDWFKDAGYQSWMASDPTSAARVLLNCEQWYPGKDRFAFQMEDLAGRQVMIGFASQLKEALAILNESTWKATSSDIDAWRRDGPAERGDGLERRARFGFAVVSQLADQAVEHELPILLDY